MKKRFKIIFSFSYVLFIGEMDEFYIVDKETGEIFYDIFDVL